MDMEGRRHRRSSRLDLVCGGVSHFDTSISLVPFSGRLCALPATERRDLGLGQPELVKDLEQLLVVVETAESHAMRAIRVV